MEFKLNFNLPESSINLTYNDSVVLIGSCFSDEIGLKLKDAGFNVESNSFGTLFHPSAIANVIKSSLEESKSVDVFERDDLFFSWDSASKIYALSKDELIEKVNQTRALFYSKIKSARVIIITLGTAWKYELIPSGKTVGNCHKAPQSLFTKSLSSIDDMLKEWQDALDLIRRINPSIKIIFTVSPVRHIKDGLIENNRSKARLIELVHTFTSLPDIYYFPAYEILMDELRDYRFYEEDLIHPNKLAIQYIWKNFVRNIISEDAQLILKERNQIIEQSNHKSLHPNSKLEIKRKNLLELKVKEFNSKYPNILIK